MPEQPHNTNGAAVVLTEAQLSRIREPYENGLYLRAWELANAAGDLRHWHGPDAEILAARLAMNLGGMRLGNALMFRAYRRHPTDPQVAVYRLRLAGERFGLYWARQFANSHSLPEGSPDEFRADWHSYQAVVAACLRDFESADELMAQAISLAPNQPWTHVDRAVVLEQEDRYEEALEAARHALELQPWYRPAVQCAAHQLCLQAKDEQALELLTEASGHLECGHIVVQLATLQNELGLRLEARRTLDRVEPLYPLADKHMKRCIHDMRTDAAYHSADYAAYIDMGSKSENSFLKKSARQIEEIGDSGNRVRLPVGFVRQHHVTCAPATLTAIARFWGKSAEHVNIVEEICYDGTPAHNERNWATSHGWIAREFTVTWDSAVALLDRGIPFTLTTVDPGSAHLQACIGYDARRRTLLIRDPYMRHYREAEADTFFETYRSTGPRGMTMVPTEKADLLDGVQLPDAELYDLNHRLQTALVRHDRPDAVGAMNQLEQQASGQRLAIWGRRSIAAYDANPEAQLTCIERLLKLFPDDPILMLWRLDFLRDLGHDEERRKVFEWAVSRKESSPIFWQNFAQDLSSDASQTGRAQWLLRKCLRVMPTNPATWFCLGSIHARSLADEQAMDAYRIASCLNDKNDQYCRTYFSYARHLKRQEQALGTLRYRCDRFAKRSGQPTAALYQALQGLSRTQEAFEVLEKGLQIRPDDGDLAVWAADEYARFGQFDRARELLARADGHSRRNDVIRTSARIAMFQGDLPASLELWKKLLELEPQSPEANSETANLLAQVQGRAAALDHLRACVRRFDHNRPLLQLLASWLEVENDVELELVLQRLIDLNPADAEAHRRRAMTLLRLGRDADAVTAASEGLRLTPNRSDMHVAMAGVLAARGDDADARRHLRRAVELCIDDEQAIAALVESARSPESRREELAFIHGEMARQTNYGQGLLAYRQWAHQTLDDAELLAQMVEAHAARPDLWQTWAGVARQHLDGGRLADALSVLQDATARFPQAAAVWVELSVAQEMAGQFDAEAETLQKAINLAPTYAIAIRRLAWNCLRRRDFDGAKKLYDRNIAANPLDEWGYAGLGDLYWRTGRRDEALDLFRRAIMLNPRDTWIWNRLLNWAAELGRNDFPLQAARELTRRRPGDGMCWYLLVWAAGDGMPMQQRLAYLDHGIGLEPRNLSIHHYKAWLLAEHARYDEARQACQHPAWHGRIPSPLRMRLACIDYEQGLKEQARDGMKALLDADPNFARGWQELANWRRQDDDKPGFLEAARKVRELQPTESTSHALVAEAHELLQQWDEAISSHRRALELDPVIPQSAYGLCDLLLSKDRLDEAAQAVEHLKSYFPGDLTLTREVQLLSAQRHADAAIERFRELCRIPSAGAWAIQNAAAAIRRLRPGETSIQLIMEIALADPVSSELGAALVRRLMDDNAIGRLSVVLDTLRFGGRPPGKLVGLFTNRARPGESREILRKSMVAFLGRSTDLGNHPEVVALVGRVTAKYRDWLRANDELWAACGDVLLAWRRYRQCADWMNDWAARRNINPGMLTILSGCHRETGNDDDARRIEAEASRLAPDKPSIPLLMWRAWDLACAGNPEAETILASVPDGHLWNYYRLLRTVARATLAVQTEQSARIDRYRHCRRTMDQALREYAFYKSHPALRRAVVRCTRITWQHTRSLGALWWHLMIRTR